MPLDVVTVPCLKDNYAFLLHNPQTGETALVDAPEAGPIQEALETRGWTLTDILLTHHHWDHVDGLAKLRGAARVIGAKADEGRLPALDLSVSQGDDIRVCGEAVHVYDVSGHTVGHIAFVMPGIDHAFTADSLMAMGCGRLFEGTPEMMWESLKKLRALPGETVICSGHEYTRSNMDFALSLEPDNPDLISRSERIDAARANGEPTVPSTLALECLTNPFLRADDDALKAAVGLHDADPAEVFAHIRQRKDDF